MSRLNRRDVTEILELLEDGLNAIPRLEKVEKMKMRAKIRQQENWLAASDNPSPEKVLIKLKDRLSEIFRSYPHGFSDKLGDLLKSKVVHLEKE